MFYFFIIFREPRKFIFITNGSNVRQRRCQAKQRPRQIFVYACGGFPSKSIAVVERPFK